MNKSYRIGIFGDFYISRYSQVKTNEALDHASRKLSISIDAVWLPTKSLGKHRHADLKNFYGFWAGPGDYLYSDRMLEAIKLCRERQLPFIGT